VTIFFLQNDRYISEMAQFIQLEEHSCYQKPIEIDMLFME